MKGIDNHSILTRGFSSRQLIRGEAHLQHPSEMRCETAESDLAHGIGWMEELIRPLATAMPHLRRPGQALLCGAHVNDTGWKGSGRGSRVLLIVMRHTRVGDRRCRFLRRDRTIRRGMSCTADRSRGEKPLFE